MWQVWEQKPAAAHWLVRSKLWIEREGREKSDCLLKKTSKQKIANAKWFYSCLKVKACACARPCVRVCVCACERVCVWACACVWVCACVRVHVSTSFTPSPLKVIWKWWFMYVPRKWMSVSFELWYDCNRCWSFSRSCKHEPNNTIINKIILYALCTKYKYHGIRINISPLYEKVKQVYSFRVILMKKWPLSSGLLMTPFSNARAKYKTNKQKNYVCYRVNEI